MSFIKRKKRIRFEPALFEENASYLPNPSCGWYRIYPFVIEKMPDFEELYWCLRPEEKIALVLVDIGAFRDDVISDDALGNLDEILKFFRKHDKEVILRITYDREGRGMEREPDFISTVIGHMQQLGAVIRLHRSQILVVQGVLVGSWGEMHDSKFLSEERLRQLLCAWQDALKDIAIAVRTPQQWRLLHREDSEPGEDRVGLFNDGMFGSEDHLGTYGWQKKAQAGWRGQWCKEEEAEFAGRIASVVPFGGEAVGESLDWTTRDVIEEMRRTGVCYLNCMHDMQRLGQWKETECRMAGVWEGKCLYDYIGCHLGYRFTIRGAEFICKKGLYLKIQIENTGFSSLKEDAELLLYMGKDKYFVLPDSLCGVGSQEVKDIVAELPQELAESICPLSLAMRRKRDGHKILFANESLEDGRVVLGRVV